MKLLLYSHYFAPSVGGVETIVRLLAKGLAQLPSSKTEKAYKLTLATQTEAGNFDDTTLPFAVVRKPAFSKLCKLISEADVVHVAGPAILPLLIALWKKKPVVLEHHGFQTICPNGQLLFASTQLPCPGHFMAGNHQECFRCNAGEGVGGSGKLWILTFLRRFLAKRVSTNVAPTAWLGNLLKLPRTVTIFHGLEPLTVISPAKQAPANPPEIVFQGRLVTTKGARLLLDAAAELQKQGRQFHMKFIGDGPQRAELAQLAEAMSLTKAVSFTGRLTAAQLDAELSDASIVAIPSLGGEVFGLVVAENMQRGLPIVVSDLGAFVEVLGDAGLVFPVGNAEELAKCIAKLMDDPELRRELGARALSRAGRVFSLEEMTNAHDRVYQNSLKTD